MDYILSRLQGRSFNLTEGVYRFLSNTYESLITQPIPDLPLTAGTARLHARMMEHHRQQFLTEEYIEDRISNPVAGTIDHIHAEVTASLAVELAGHADLPPYAVELLRLAGHMHDSERAFPKTMVRGEEKYRNDPLMYKKFKKLHAEKSAETVRSVGRVFIEDRDNEAEKFINDASYLVIRHEIGGEKLNGSTRNRPSAVSPEINLNLLADILCEADSLAYFYANILTNWIECGRDIESLTHKIHFMYDRIGDSARRELRLRILGNENHILGPGKSGDQDIEIIRETLLAISS